MMVSALWKACSEGSLDDVKQLLATSNEVDVEIKDHTGCTPLIEAIKNGHVEIVKALLDKGADPTNRSSQGPPEQYTTDPTILDLLRSATEKKQMNNNSVHENGQVPTDAGADSQNYYPHTEVYTYFPTLNSAPPPLPEGAVYYPPPPPPQGSEVPAGDARNLPPPDIARYIPCRYFPACRYGSSCMFLHPQGPYFQGPLPPPAQYPAPYDPMVPAPYPPNYYAPQPPNGVPPMAPMSPPSATVPPMMHARTGSEVVSPAQTHFSPQAAPPPLPYGPMSPIPAAYHPGPVPVPMSVPPVPPAHPQVPAPQGPQSPPIMYNGPAPPVPPYVVRSDAGGQYPPPLPNTMPPPSGPDPNAGPKPVPSESYAQAPFRDGTGSTRRGNGRRSSFASRKPPCFFFPAGRCKNGDDCRFPHILEPQGQHIQSQNPNRGAGRAARGHVSGTGLEQKFGAMSIRDDNGQSRGLNGIERSNSADNNGRPRFQGLKTNQSIVNSKKLPAKQPQRVPNPDEFPVLAGSITPPTRSPGLNGVFNGNGITGPTAAQVLQAPAPIRRDSTRESSTRGASPDSAKATKPQEPSAEVKGVNGTAEQYRELSAPVPNKLPISFAAVATAAPDVSPKEIRVSA